jgi:hypothetical protein
LNRFGANAIFEAKDSKDITDEDIDAILGLIFFENLNNKNENNYTYDEQACFFIYLS